jgi:hypothetical protein
MQKKSSAHLFLCLSLKTALTESGSVLHPTLIAHRWNKSREEKQKDAEDAGSRGRAYMYTLWLLVCVRPECQLFYSQDRAIGSILNAAGSLLLTPPPLIATHTYTFANTAHSCTVYTLRPQKHTIYLHYTRSEQIERNGWAPVLIININVRRWKSQRWNFDVEIIWLFFKLEQFNQGSHKPRFYWKHQQAE